MNIKVRIFHDPSGRLFHLSIRDLMTTDLRGLYYTEDFEYPFDEEEFTPLLGVELGDTELYVGDYVRMTHRYNQVYEEGALGEVTWDGCGLIVNWKVLLGYNKVHYRDPISTIMSNEVSGTYEVIGNRFQDEGLLKERVHDLMEEWGAEKRD